jgi:hypothetical protein
LIFLLPSLSLIVALWVFFDSQKHDFSFGRGLLWAVLVFSVLFIFLPVYLVVRKKPRLRQEDAQETPPVWRTCFYCRQTYEGEPGQCPHCGQDLSRR